MLLPCCYHIWSSFPSSKVHTLRVKNGPELPPEGGKWELSPGSYLNGTKEQNKEKKILFLGFLSHNVFLECSRHADTFKTL